MPKEGHIISNAWRVKGIAALAVLMLAACASGRVVDGIFVDETRGFKIPLLRDGWRQFEVEGTELAFQSESGGQVIAMFVSCEEQQPIALRILARRLFFGINSKQVVAQNVISLNGTEAVHTVLTGRLKETEVMVSSYVATDGECAYDLVYVASPDTFQDRLPEFERLVQGWVLTEKGSGLQVPSSDLR